ncbi:L,D-transpeptidase [Streptomyces prasinopilosus]|uniref:L,D-transpeptidase n=1 Tax=Streptomyces prasinopilosus TaxID=67344 RepID=UPI0006EBC051|nr:L,D-transpeptidase [Streptomyces prasinopilosus]
MADNSSAIVTGLTAAALLTVGVLGHRAAANAPAAPHADRADTARTALRADRDGGSPAAPPKGSGRGPRVVYDLGDDRVWLVGSGGEVRRTFTVSPSTVDPEPGTYRVTSRSKNITGSDGVPVEHVVRFASNDGTAIGFSAAVDGSAPHLDPRIRTGGIRETREDGEAMWRFATIGRAVVVVR